MVFSIILFASIWASDGIHRVRLQYESCATTSMYAFRLIGWRIGELVGNTESLLAKELEKGK